MGGTPASRHGQPGAAAAVSASLAEKKPPVVGVTPAKKGPPVVMEMAAPSMHDAGRRAPAGRSVQVVPQSTAWDPLQAH